ncbi:MAG: fenitrothion hydrolase, partial [Actinomycetota bacterium]
MISLVLPLAHGLLVGRQDLPIPTWLFAWGASLVLIVSFVALSVAWRDSKLSSDRWRPVSERPSRHLTGRGAEIVTGAIGVILLGAVVYAGLAGTDEPNLNFAVTFVFVTFWLGMVVLSILLGDVFRAFNPWRAIARAAGAVFRLIAGQPHSAPLRYPERLGRF